MDGHTGERRRGEERGEGGQLEEFSLEVKENGDQGRRENLQQSLHAWMRLHQHKDTNTNTTDMRNTLEP